jgi:ubiquinone/menaquinone biosynthesis C-methylase UbiE
MTELEKHAATHLTSFIKLESPILDIGGSHKLLQFLNLEGQNYIGIDPEGEPPFLKMRAEDLKFESNCFKTVLFLSVLDHVNELDESLSEIWRVLHIAGKCYISTTIRKYRLFSLTSASYYTKWIKRKDFYKEYLEAHKRFFTPSSLQRAFKKNNLTLKLYPGFYWNQVYGIAQKLTK